MAQYPANNIQAPTHAERFMRVLTMGRDQTKPTNLGKIPSAEVRRRIPKSSKECHQKAGQMSAMRKDFVTRVSSAQLVNNMDINNTVGKVNGA